MVGRLPRQEKSSKKVPGLGGFIMGWRQGQGTRVSRAGVVYFKTFFASQILHRALWGFIPRKTYARRTWLARMLA